jgi:hypothetical protein
MPRTVNKGTPSQGASSPGCPRCGGPMWDNRASKRNAKAPDFRCRDRACGGVIWPSKHGAAFRLFAPADRPVSTPTRLKEILRRGKGVFFHGRDPEGQGSGP